MPDFYSIIVKCTTHTANNNQQLAAVRTIYLPCKYKIIKCNFDNKREIMGLLYTMVRKIDKIIKVSLNMLNLCCSLY